jgi:ABC-type sulfate transport system permease subunit
MNALFALALLQEETSTGVSPAAAGGLGLIAICYFAVILLIVISLWKIFVKAGKPGWAAIVPIYNIIVLLEIAGKPLWWFILMLIPFVNFIVLIIVVIQVAKNFGKGTGFAIGMIFLPFIFYPMLAFGDAKYQPVP